MTNNIKATMNVMLVITGKIMLMLLAMTAAYAFIFRIGGIETDIGYLIKMMIGAGASAIFFTSAGVYEQLCIGSGCTRRDYFISMQAIKVILSIVVAVISFAVDATSAGIENMSSDSIVTNILTYLAAYSVAELMGYAFRKIGRWGLVIFMFIICFGAGIVGAILAVNADVSFNLPAIIKYGLPLGSAAAAVIATAISYFMNKKYVVWG